MSSEPLTMEPGGEITDIELAMLTQKLISGVTEGLSVEHLFGVLTDDDNALMTRLAYHDEFEVSKLETKVRVAIIERGDGEPAARRFNLTRYRKNAKVQRERFEADKERKAKIAMRNGKIADGAAPDEEVRRVMDAAPDQPETRAKLYSQSAFLKCVGQLEAYRRGRIWYDDFHNNIFTDWDGSAVDTVITQRTIDDKFVLKVLEWVQMLDVNLAKQASETTVRQAIMHFAHSDVRSEPRDWITKLVWDNTPRLSIWLSAVYGVETDDEGYHAAVGRCWMTSMAARIMQPGCKVDTMPVLIGPQGNRKSTSLRILGGSWYKTINTSIDKYADFLMTLSGALVAEIAELDAISRAADSRVKSMLSTAVDVYRPPYGRTTMEFKRTAVLCGSTNERGNWHKDDSGGRRYWPIECDGEINTEWLEQNRDQLFAEALVYYDGGKGVWWDVPKAAQEKRIEEHHIGDAWQDKLERWINAHAMELWLGPDSEVERDFGDPTAADGSKYWGNVLTTASITARALEIPAERQNRVTQVRVGQSMRNLGFVQTPSRIPGGKLQRLWITPSAAGTEFELQTMLPKA